MTTATKTKERGARAERFLMAVPPKLAVPASVLRVRLDLYDDVCTLTEFSRSGNSVRMVAPIDVAQAVSAELTLSSGLLPESCLWWSNTAAGQLVAVWREPQVWKVALQLHHDKPVERYHLPMPGLIFLCRAGSPPYVFAAGQRPTSPDEPIYHCPTYNVFRNGRVCAGSHKFPVDPAKVPESFFASFFSAEGDISGRLAKAKSLGGLWQALDGKKTFPRAELVQAGMVKDLFEVGGAA